MSLPVAAREPLSEDSELSSQRWWEPIGQLVDCYVLPVVEIPSSTCLVIKDGGKLRTMHGVMLNKSEYNEVCCRKQ